MHSLFLPLKADTLEEDEGDSDQRFGIFQDLVQMSSVCDTEFL